MKAYDSYKDSGVEWIGKIPTNWTAKRLSYSIAIQKGKIPKNLTSEKLIDSLPYLSMGVLRGDKPMEFSNENGIVHVSKGDIGLLWDGSNSGEVIRINREGILSSTVSLLTLKDNSIDKEFCFYLLKFYENDFKENTIGMGIPHVSGDHVRESKLIIPPYSEQQQIVSYLDAKTSLIDSLIEKTQRKIELLKEKRTSLINQVVTKGLNPNAEIKDSGVEWIGEIPIDWENGKLGYYSNVFRGSGYQYLNQVDDDYEGVKERVVRISDITDFNPIWCEYKEQFENYRIKPDNILIGGTGHYFGKSIYVTKEMEGLIHSYNIIRVVIKKQYPKYVQYWLSSSNIREQMDISVLGSGQPFIDIQGLKDLQVIIPPLSEQYEIVSYLDEQTQKIDKSILKEEERTNLLKEYRQSLISSVVTGKIKVTEDA